jgi:hypothetical protein
MTDQIANNVTDKDRELARKWAELIEANPNSWGLRIRAVARVILNAVPTAPRPTLAEMPPEERGACRWMQADTAGSSDTCVLFVIGTGSAKGIAKDGRVTTGPHECFTPRPDLPRLEWPGDKKVEDANTVKVGDLIESADDPRLDALPVGSILLDRDNDAATKRAESWSGAGYEPIPDEGDDGGPWRVAHIGQGADQ